MPIIGLEIHVQVNTESKLFCECPNDQTIEEPNTIICERCTAQPGAKPLPPNAKALELAYNAAYMLNCNLQDKFYFMRKHYFYPDLPSGYQRTSTPLGKDGKLGKIGIWEVHVEEDPGRYELKKGLVDYNRAGTPLIEIVTAPDMRSPEEAESFLGQLERALRYYNILKKDGVMKADANVSLEGSARVEVKNINSFQNVLLALRYEIKRQTELIKEGKTVDRETRHFDEDKGITKTLRKKETELDYRYLPDPDLLPVEYDVADIMPSFGERPWERGLRFIKTYKIATETAEILTSEKPLADLFEQLAEDLPPEQVANWLKGPFKKQLNYRALTTFDHPLADADVKAIAKLFLSGKISDDGMERLLIAMLDKKLKNADNVAKDLNLFIIGEDELRTIVEKVIGANSGRAVIDYHKDPKVLSFLVGQVMKESKGRADPKHAAKIIEQRLGRYTYETIHQIEKSRLKNNK